MTNAPSPTRHNLEFVTDILTSRGCLSVSTPTIPTVNHDGAMWDNVPEWAESVNPISTAQARFREVGISEQWISDRDLADTLFFLLVDVRADHERWLMVENASMFEAERINSERQIW